jgi:glycosyltransferase involved in cell wall biosynthesis
MAERLLIVSPVRNEAAHIERVVAAVARQTRPPDRWIVVDDGSTDGTLALLRALAPAVPFMRVLQAPPAPPARDRLARAAAPRTFNVGIAAEAPLECTHVGKLDGDVELPADYFERLLGEFRRDPRLGIACGDLEEIGPDGRERLLVIPRHHVHGALKLYSRECYDAIGGVQERLGWDTIDETYARLRGFRTRSFGDLVAVHHRPAGSADGRLRGRARHGECAWIAHFSPWWVAARSVKVAGNPPVGLSGAAFLFGYVRCALRGTPRVEDPEFRRFARWELRQRMRRALRLPPGRKFAARPAVSPVGD